MARLIRNAEAFGQAALRWDAAYCAVAGIAITGFATAIEHHLQVAAWIVAIVGIGTVAWAGVIAWLGRRRPWRQSVRIVAAANGLAAAAIGYWAWTRGGPGGVVLGLLALQVVGFGIAQVWALAES